MTDGELLAYAHTLFDFDLEKGKIYWKWIDYGPNPTCHQKIRNARFAGKEAGSVNQNGYRQIWLSNGEKTKTHRLIFLVANGYLPPTIDHINTILLDNRPVNLRAATRSDNGCNRGKNHNNTSKFKGVCWNKRLGLWQMQCTRHRIKHASYHSTAEEAAEAYRKKSSEIHGEFSRWE